MKKYLTLISLFIFALLLIGCNTHEHYYEKQYVDPTCIEPGTIIYTCECNDSYTETVSEPLGHLYGEWEITKKPTINIEGSKEQKCSRCNNINTEQIEKREYPDLGGYTIEIAVASDRLSYYDPFYYYYNYADKEAKQKAMREVENDFNCLIKYVEYPESAEWGPKRWNYLIENINNKTIEYDFCEVPHSIISDFVKNGGIINLNEYYNKYSQNLMNNVQLLSGTYKNDLYTISDVRKHDMMIMIYDLVLFNQLRDVDPTLKEPAEIYLEENWTTDVFLKYCEQIQNAMEKLYGDKGKKGSESQEYYVFSGWPTYLWEGLASGSNEPLLDINNMSVNYATENKINSINLVKELYDNNYIDPKFAFTGGSECFNNKKALFECGELFDYTLSYNKIYGYKLTDLGFVLFPREKDLEFSNVKIPLWNSRYFIMINQDDYSNYGNECTSEYIYWAYSEFIKRTKAYTENKEWDIFSSSSEITDICCDSEASKAMYKYLCDKINNNEIYYEPILDYDYKNTLFSSLLDFSTSQSMNTYLKYSNGKTWQQLTIGVVDDLEKILKKNYD